MPLMLKKQRDGSLRPFWYGVYIDGGKRKVANLNIPVKGTPPTSLSLKEMGDAVFERSRTLAEAELQRVSGEIQHKGRADHLTERLIESKTGQKLAYVRLDELADRWKKIGRSAPATKQHLDNCATVFNRFDDFVRNRKPQVEFLYEVSKDDANAWVAKL